MSNFKGKNYNYIVMDAVAGAGDLSLVGGAVKFGNPLQYVCDYNGMNYITYLNSSDCVEVVHLHDLPMEFSSGSLAMWHAAKSGFSDITLVGFGDTTHCYTEDYTGPNPRWEKEREYIINTFFNINWRRI